MTQPLLQIPEEARSGVVAVGNFDGVHCGHQQMLKEVGQVAAELNCATVILTFDPHPITVLRPETQLARLSTIPQRIELLRRYGADHVVILPVSQQLLQMSARQFFDNIIVGQLNAAAIIEGPDFRFGCDREGDVRLLKEFCQKQNVRFQVIDSFLSEDKQVSSSHLRKLISEGNIQAANELFQRPYSFSGTVVPGAGRGRTLGVPTANLSGIAVLLPADGVYVGETTIDGQSRPVALSIGPNPTFDDGDRKVECHVLDFEGDLYGQQLNIFLRKRLRGLIPFDGSEALIHQIQLDLQAAKLEFDATEIRSQDR